VTPSRGWGPATIWYWRVRLRASDVLGGAYAWVSEKGVLRLILLLATVAALLFMPIPQWATLLAVGAVVLVLAGVRAHRRIVIEAFDDYRGQPSGGRGESSEDAGSAVFLANRLAWMRDLYGFVDDPDRTPTPNRPTGATVQLEDPASVLQSAVTTESKVSVGPISIPLGAAVSLLGRFVQAPRLRGAIHGDASKIFMTAELTLDGQAYSWRVVKDVDASEGPRRELEAMINDDLAYRIFSDLTLQHQARWPATKYWVLALENVAQCQRRPRNRRLLLKRAEDNFMHALAEDQAFYLACLNLGVVYRRLAEVESPHRAKGYMFAARRALERAIDIRPDRWEAYHALAEAQTDARNASPDKLEAQWRALGPVGTLEMIAGLCERANSRNRDDRPAQARILDLEGQAQAMSGRAELRFVDAIATRQRACQIALSELAKARLRQANAQQAARLTALTNLASQCVLNLAWTVSDAHPGGRERSAFRTVSRMARLAIQLSDVDASARNKLAELALRHDLELAAAEASAAVQIAPTHPLYAAQLALALASNKRGTRPGRALEVCARVERLIDFGKPEHIRAQERLIKAYRTLGGADNDARADQLEKRKELVGDLESCERPVPDDAGPAEREKAHEESVRALEGLLARYGGERDWEAARVRARLGQVIHDGPGSREKRSKLAARYLHEALAWYDDKQPDDNWLAQLHSARARGLALWPASAGEALEEAESAAILNPLSAEYRDHLAAVYEASGDLKSACDAATEALRLEPDDPRLHHRLAMLKWKLAETLPDAAMHAATREEASAQFEEALTLYASDQRPARRTTSWWLAMSYFAMSRFTEAPAHLRFVLASIANGAQADYEERGLQAVTHLWLAKTYRKLEKFLEARAHADEAVKTAKALIESRVPLTRSLAAQMQDERWPLWAVLALAQMQVAGYQTDRNGNLKDAGDRLDDAGSWVELAARDPEIREAARSDTYGDVYEDTYADYQAERGRLWLAEDDAEEAIARLEESVDIDPDEADVYLLLAQAHARAAEKRLERDWQAHIHKARQACARTREIGGDDHPDAKAAEELEGRLKRIEREAARAPGAGGIGGKG